MTAGRKRTPGVVSPAPKHELSEQPAPKARQGNNASTHTVANPRALRASVPAALRELPCWLLWRYSRSKNGKALKVPYYLNGSMRRGKQGTPADRANLATFDQVLQEFERRTDRGWAGVGLAMLPGGNLVALDFDRKPNTVDPLSEAEVSALCDGTYIERSPSGQAYRAFFTGSMEKIAGGARGIEVFPHAQFVTVTGDKLAHASRNLSDLSEATKVRLRTLAAKPASQVAPADDSLKSLKASSGVVPEVTLPMAGDMLRWLKPTTWDDYDSWLRVGFALHHQFAGAPEALELWDQASQRSPRYEHGVCEAKWATMLDDKASNYTILSVMHEARSNGWLAPGESAGNDVLRLHNPLHEQPKRIGYMLEAPVWLPDLSEQAIVFGRSETFKSVLTQGLCVHMAAGVSLDGQAVAPRVVVYAAEEAPMLWDNNLHAWRQHYALTLDEATRDHAIRNLEAGYLQRIDGNISGLTDKRAKELAVLVRQQQDRLASELRPVVVLDPVAEVLLGNESSTDDMRAYIGAGRLLQRATGALVLHVHHTGHNETDRERGSSTLPAAMFVRYQARRDSPGAYAVELECKKHKARAKPEPSRWQVVQVDLFPAGEEPGQEPLTGVVVQFVGAAAPRPTPQDMAAEAREGELVGLLRAYRETPDIGGKRLREVLGIGGAKLEGLRKTAMQRGLMGPGGGEGRAAYSLTDAGRAYLNAAIPKEVAEDEADLDEEDVL